MHTQKGIVQCAHTIISGHDTRVVLCVVWALSLREGGRERERENSNAMQ